MDAPLFPEIPQDLSGLTDEELATHRDGLLARIKEVAQARRDPDIVGELTQSQVTDALEQAVTALETVKDELQQRTDDAAAYDARVEELANKAGVEPKDESPEGDDSDGDDEDGDGDESATEPTAETEAEKADEKKPEPVAASAAAPATRRPLPAARRHKPKPETHDSRGLRVTQQAAGVITSSDAGELFDRRSLGEALNEVVKKGRVKPGQRMIVASASYDYPDDHVLDQNAGAENTYKIQRVVGKGIRGETDLQALVASGALCAPLTPIYDLPGVETAVRPVRDALPSFQATRGGVIVGAAPGMGVYDDAVDVVTNADNAAGGTFAVKNCRRIDCPAFDSIEVDSIYHCIEADNLAARAYPELMARIDELVRAEQARLADGYLLTAMKALSTSVTGGSLIAGAVWSLLGDVYRAAAAYRSRHRMPEGAVLQTLFPAWIIDVLALDIARGQFDRFQTRQQIETILEGGGIRATFYLDGSSNATNGQVFGAQSAGVDLIDFPDTVEWFLYAPGTFLHLDAGVLELGVVRDSSLNATNDFQIFGETWEQVAKVGVEALVVTSDVCPTGEVALPTDTVHGHCGT